MHETQKIKNLLKKESEASDFDAFVKNEIIDVFSEPTAENIIKVAKECRRNGNFLMFNAVYQWKTIYGDLKKRNVLKLISAVYRIRYTKSLCKYPKIYSLKSDVKYATACSDCGSIAKNLYMRLVKEGYMTV